MNKPPSRNPSSHRGRHRNRKTFRQTTPSKRRGHKTQASQPETEKPDISDIMKSFKVSRHARLDNGHRVRLASSANRLAAKILDTMTMTILAMLMLIAAERTILNLPEDFDINNNLSGDLLIRFLVTFVLSFLIVGFVYEVLLTGLAGRTLGRVFVQIKIIRTDNGATMGIGKSLLRWMIPALLASGCVAGFVASGLGGIIPPIGIMLGLGALLVYASLNWDENRQGWHDKIAGTVVIKSD